MNVKTCTKEFELRGIHRYLLLLMIVIVGIAAVLLSPDIAFADSSGTCGDGLTWTLSDDGELEISGSGSLSGASWNEQNVLQVTIPEGVTSIEEGLFMGCVNLVNINVSPSNNYYSSADGVLLSKDKTILVEFPAGRSGAYTIPGTVKSVLIGAFASCKKVTSVTMPDSLTTLGKYAFNCCDGLTKVVISKGVTVIPRDCFSNCSSLTSVTIPEGVKKIDESAFWGCKSLTSVTIPKSIENKGIAHDAFDGCPLDKSSQAAVNAKLRDEASATSEYELEVGDKRDYQLSPTIEGGMIDGYFYAESSNTSVVQIASLTRNGSIVYANAVRYYYVLGVKAVGPGSAVVTVYTDKTKSKVLSKTTLTVTGEAPGGGAAQHVTTVTSGNGVYKISGSSATLLKPKNKSITSLSIPATISVNGRKYNVTAVSAKACKGLKKLKTLTIGANVDSIGAYAFQNCSKLKTITIRTTKLTSKNVKSKAFKGTPKTVKVKVPKKVKKAYKKWLTKKGISKKAKIK